MLSLRTGPLRALSHSNYAKVFFGAFVSNVGTWMETIAVGVYVTETTGKAGWTGTVAALTFLPAVVVGPLGGALADRFERRSYLMRVTAFQLFIAALLAGLAIAGRLSVPSIAVLMFSAGVASTLGGAAYNAFLAELVPPADLMSALTLSSAQFNMARVVGPLLAGLAIASAGLGLAFTLNAVSFLAVLGALFWTKGRTLPHPSDRPLWEEIKIALHVAYKDDGIRRTLWLVAASSLLIAPFIGLIPAFAIKRFDEGATGASGLVAAQGMGAVLSALASTTFSDLYGRRRLLVWAVFLLGPVAGLYWLAPYFSFAMVAMFALGAIYLAVVTTSVSICLSRAPKALQARVSSFFSTVLGTFYAVGVVAMGWLGDLVGLPAAGASAAGLFFAALIFARLKHPEVFHSVSAPRGAALAPDTGPIPAIAGPGEVKISPK